MTFLSNVFSIKFDEVTRRTIIRFLGFKIRLAGKALKSNKYQDFKDAGGDITNAPKADGLYRVIQLANFEILKRVDKICRENNLDLWLTFGTLLGAVRHKGFIPWDDDIDVEMTRDHYNKLIGIINAMEDSDLYTELVHGDKDVNIFLKIRHKAIPGIFIDITPVDYTNQKMSKKDRLKLSKKIKFFRRLMNVKIRQYMKTKDVASLVNYINKKSNTFFKFSNIEKIENSDIVWGIDFQHKMNDYLVYSHSTYFPLKEIEFEGVKFKCPNDLDTFLTEMYGNYMSWPSKLYAHHSSFAKNQTIRGFYGEVATDKLLEFLNTTEEELERI